MLLFLNDRYYGNNVTMPLDYLAKQKLHFYNINDNNRLNYINLSYIIFISMKNQYKY